MIGRRLGIAGLSVLAAGCMSHSSWSSEPSSVSAPAAERGELERQRKAAVGSGDVETLSTYMRYLWQFDREHRAWLDAVEVGKSPKLPESLADFDRQRYTSEALDAWQALRPAALPSSAARETFMRAHFYATALRAGCRESQRALAPLLVLTAEEPETPDIEVELAMLRSECGHADDSFNLACRTAADLLVTLPRVTYDDLDGDMWPDAPLIVRFASFCGGVLDEQEAAAVADYNAKAEPWFAEHHPEEHAAWVEEQRQIAAAIAREQARRDAERQAAQAAAAAQAAQSNSSSSAPAGGGTVSVSLYSDCKETVTLFFGDKPRFSSGITRTHAYNTSTSYSMREGDMIWIVQDGQGVGSYSASAGNSSIKITSGCGGFAPR